MAASQPPTEASAQASGEELEPDSDGGEDSGTLTGESDGSGAGEETDPQHSGTETDPEQGTGETGPWHNGAGEADGTGETDPQHNATGEDPQGISPNAGAGQEPQGATSTGKTEAQRACETAGGIWAEHPSSGYFCGQNGTITGSPGQETEGQKKEMEIAEKVLGVAECAQDVATAVFIALSPHGKVIDAGVKGLRGVGIIQDLDTGNTEEAAWKAIKYRFKGVGCYKVLIAAIGH
jgi:hypothetical protein